jgi:hypothetical protein
MKELLQETLSLSNNTLLNKIYTAIPCVVVGVVQNLETVTVNIQPSINQRTKDDTVKPRSVILGVPVVFPCSSTAGFTFPIKAGDTGLAVFSMRNLDAWKSSNGYPTAPLNFAKFDKGDAIFIPGLQTPGNTINNPVTRNWQHDTSDAVLVNNIGTLSEVEVRLKADGDLIINTSKKVQINCNEADVVANTSISLTAPLLNVDATTTNWIGAINHTGAYNSTGTMTFNGIVFNTHVHGTSPGPSNP